MDLHGLPLRAEAFFRDQRIDLRLGVRATGIDRAARRVETQRRRRDRLRPSDPRDRRRDSGGSTRRASICPGVFVLRNHRRRDRDPRAARRRAQGRRDRRGLHRARDRGDRGEPRRRSQRGRDRAADGARRLADHVGFLPRRRTAAFGAQVRLGVGVSAIKGADKAEAVVLTDGEVLPADLVVVGVGVTAEDQLARDSGLECANGVVVDAHLCGPRTRPISAIGDCADFPNAALGFRTRLESIQNAVDQAKCVAARLAGKPAPYDALAWFWSDQGDLKLMIAGLSHGVDTWVVRGDPETRAFSTFGFRGGKLAVVESVNRAGDHAAAKRIIGTPKTLTPEEAANPGFDLRALAKR